MRPYRYCCKRFLQQGNLRQKIWIFLQLVLEDLEAVWLLELPFPTSVKIIITILLTMVVVLFLSIPILVFVWSLASWDYIVSPLYIDGWKSSLVYPYMTLLINLLKFGNNVSKVGGGKRVASRKGMAVIHDTLLRGILVGNTLATSIDYMHMIRRFVNNAL